MGDRSGVGGDPPKQPPLPVWLWVVLGILALCLVFLLASCALKTGTVAPQEVIITVKAKEATELRIEDSIQIDRTMVIPNPEGSLSPLSFISKDRAFITIFSGLTVDDVKKLWCDFNVLEYNTDIRKADLFISSPGGDAFTGLALADQIERARRKGFHIIAHASGIVASAAIPVFAACNERLAAPGTIFMVHQTSLWKWPGRETASDIRAQNELLVLLQDRYLAVLANHSQLSKEEWRKMEYKTTWFSAEQAQQWGLVDAIE